MRSIRFLDISVFGHFSSWARLCRILAGGCTGISRVRRVRVRFGVKVRVRDRCVKGLKCPRTEVTVGYTGSDKFIVQK